MAFPFDDLAWPTPSMDEDQSVYTSQARPWQPTTDTNRGWSSPPMDPIRPAQHFNCQQLDVYPGAAAHGNDFDSSLPSSHSGAHTQSGFDFVQHQQAASSPGPHRGVPMHISRTGQQAARAMSLPHMSRNPSSVSDQGLGRNGFHGNGTFNAQPQRINMATFHAADAASQQRVMQQYRVMMRQYMDQQQMVQQPTSLQMMPQDDQGMSAQANMSSAAPPNTMGAQNGIASVATPDPTTQEQTQGTLAQCIRCEMDIYLLPNTSSGMCDNCHQDGGQSSALVPTKRAHVSANNTASASPGLASKDAYTKPASTINSTHTPTVANTSTNATAVMFYASTQDARQSLVRQEPYTRLNIQEDDIQLFGRSFIQSKSKELYEAYLKPHAAPADRLSDEHKANYEVKQKKARKACEELLHTAQQKQDASARATLVIGEIMTIHNQGIPESSFRGGKNSKGYTIDKSIATVRLQKVINAVTQNKNVAKDVLEQNNIDLLARSPVTYMRRKTNNSVGNHDKQMMQQKGKEVIRSNAQRLGAMVTSPLTNGMPVTGPVVTIGGGGVLPDAPTQTTSSDPIAGTHVAILPKPTPGAIKRSRPSGESEPNHDGNGARKRSHLALGGNGA